MINVFRQSTWSTNPSKKPGKRCRNCGCSRVAVPALSLPLFPSCRCLHVLPISLVSLLLPIPSNSSPFPPLLCRERGDEHENIDVGTLTLLAHNNTCCSCYCQVRITELKPKHLSLSQTQALKAWECIHRGEGAVGRQGLQSDCTVGKAGKAS